MKNEENQLLQHDDLLQVHGGSVAFPDSLQGGKITVKRPTGISSQEEYSRAIESDADKIFQKYYKPGDTASIEKALGQVLSSMKSSYTDSDYLAPVKNRVIDKFAAMREK